MTWALLAAIFLASFTYSGIEAGILSVNRIRLRHRAKLGDGTAATLENLLRRPERLLVTVLLVTNFLNICFVLLLNGKLSAAFGTLPGAAITTAVCIPLFVIGIEILPKSLFRRFPFRALAGLAGLLRLTDLALTPVLALGRFIGRWVRRTVPDERRLFSGREEFKYLTFESERAGAITGTERQMIHNVVDFRAVTARDVMLPLERAQTIKSSASIADLLFLAHRTGLDRFPVLGSGGDITGIVDTFDVLLDPAAVGNVSRYQRRLLAVASGDLAHTVIRKMRAARLRLALVLDQAGKPIGIISHDDVILRLVSTATTPTR